MVGRPSAGPRDVGDRLQRGFFARKQIFSKVRIIAWSHRRRFETGLEIAKSFAGGSVLDYGCGDGTFLAMLANSPSPPRRAVGAECEKGIIEDCRSRLGDLPGLRFVHQDDLRGDDHVGKYDAIFCMEVLEHVVDLRPVLDLFPGLLAPSGKLVISVPVEVGLPLLVKHAARHVASWTGTYPAVTPYTFREMAASVLAGPRSVFARNLHTGAEGLPYYDHQGFNWMALRRDLLNGLAIERTVTSPITWLPPHLSSQVWFIARLKH